MACCLFAAVDEVEADPTLFDCEACPVADALDQLWPENQTAWSLSRRLFSRLAADAHCLAWVLDRETMDMDPIAALDLFDRVAVIYDALCPRVTSSES